MIHKTKLMLLSLAAVVSMASVPLVVESGVAYAQPKKELCEGSSGSWTGSTCTNTTGAPVDLPTRLRNIVNVLLFILGAIAVIMIVIGGIRYTTSNGDQSAVKSAKDTILYAIVGLIVAVMAYAIVNWIITNL